MNVPNWIVLFAVSTMLGCAAAASQPTVPAPSSGAEEAPRAAPGAEETARSESAPAVDEASVRPGINEPYFQPDALEKYTLILEAESREAVQYRDAIVEAIGLREGMVVADIGAGTGLFTTEIAKRVGDEGEVFAVDIIPAFLDRIRERVEAKGLANVTVVQGGERATGLNPASVDLAFMCDTYHHIEYPQTYMRSVFRALRPGAMLVLVDFERIEGKTDPAMLKHVRADKQTVIDEVSQAGFVLESETDLLDENYYLRFRRP